MNYAIEMQKAGLRINGRGDCFGERLARQVSL